MIVVVIRFAVTDLRLCETLITKIHLHADGKIKIKKKWQEIVNFITWIFVAQNLTKIEKYAVMDYRSIRTIFWWEYKYESYDYK